MFHLTEYINLSSLDAVTAFARFFDPNLESRTRTGNPFLILIGFLLSCAESHRSGLPSSDLRQGTGLRVLTLDVPLGQGQVPLRHVEVRVAHDPLQGEHVASIPQEIQREGMAQVVGPKGNP